MRFAFDERQLEFRAAVRQVLAKECTPADLRAAYSSPAARTERWTTLAELGVVGLTVPERHGGLALGFVDLVPLLEETGAVALPEPLVETAALAAPLLGDLEAAGELAEDPGRRWLDEIAAGTATAAVGLTASRSEPVAGADGADLLLLASEGGDGPELHAVPTDAVTVEPVASLDPTRRLGIAAWHPTSDTLLVSGPRASTFGLLTADRASVATAAVLLGLSERMIALAAEYAKERRQFGKAIGSFQAVKHLLAGAQVKLEFARPAVYAAAWSLDVEDPHASRSASTAKAVASDAATEAARVALQVHGAIGYTWECDLQLFLKRAWALSEAWGSASEHRRLVLASLLDER